MTFSPLDSALTGPLTATDEMRAVFSDSAYLAAQLRVEAALAKAQTVHDLAPKALADAIGRLSPDDFDLAAIGAAAANAGVTAIPFLAAVQAKLPEDLRGYLHRGATSQDLIDTARVLQARDGLDLIAEDLVVVLRALRRLAQAHRETPCVGRTNGQHAAPITFGYVAAVWLAGIVDVATDLARIRANGLTASLDGPVGTRAELGKKGAAVAESFAAELGLAAPDLAWHVRRARVAAVGVWLAMLIAALAKMATDVAFLSSTEVGEVAEAHAPGRGGSSSMPHKRNPVSAAVILAAHAAAPGRAASLISTMAAAGQRPVGLWQAEGHALPILFGLASGAVRAARELTGGLVVDARRMRANLDLTRGLIFSATVADALAPKLGREQAHRIVEAAAEATVRTGRDFAALLAASAEIPKSLARAVAAALDLAPAVAFAAAASDRGVVAADPAIAALKTAPGKR